MDDLARDLRYSVRRLLRAPTFTLVAVLSLALGIGANTAIFSLVNGIVLERFALEDEASLVEVYTRLPGFDYATFSYPDYVDLRDVSGGVFSDVTAARFALAQTDEAESVEMEFTQLVTGNYFPSNGIRAHLGRTLMPEDDQDRGGHFVVALGYQHWQNEFGGDPSVVGRDVSLNGRGYTVVGVIEPDYEGHIKGIVPAFYAPMTMTDQLAPGVVSDLDERGNRSLFVRARLAPGTTLEQARVLGENQVRYWRETYPDSWGADGGLNFVPTADVIMYPAIDRILVPASIMLMAVVGMVLLIACANLAGFFVARATDRRKEIAVRLALGASRRTLVRQLLTETTLLSVMGGVAGVLFARWALDALLAADLPLPFELSVDLGFDPTVLTFTAFVAVGAGILFGLIPALQSLNPNVAPTLRDEATGGGRPARITLRGALVGGQVAVSMVLLVTAGLFLRSVDASRGIDPGFGYDPTGILSVVLPIDRYDEEQGRQFLARLRERVAALPGVEDVGSTDNLHLNPMNTQGTEFIVDGFDPPPDQEYFLADRATVSEGFFEAAGIPIVAGRAFDSRDGPEGQAVAIVSEALASRFWPNGNAVGSTYRTRDGEVLVVGVAADAKVRSISEAPRFFVYLPFSRNYGTYQTVLARGSGDADRLAIGMLEIARELDPQTMVVESKTMERHLAVMFIARELGAIVLGAFAILALAMASIGLYGTVSSAVARRTREVGIRMSLGADRGQVVRMVMRSGLGTVLVGGLIGLSAAALLARGVGSLLYGVGALDPATFVGVPLVLFAVAALAAYLPARRASRVSPVRALKSD